MADSSFRDAVIKIMSNVPEGMITTYGDIAAYAGSPAAARIVGGIAHYGPDSVPWHRLVNRNGGLASAFPGGREVQRQLLEHEGIECSDTYYVREFDARRWRRNG